MPYGSAAIDAIESSGNLAITGNVTTTGTLASSAGTTYPIVSGTAQASTSGTAILFTNIPNWVKRITVIAYGISTNGTSSVGVRLGTSSGIVSSGYFSMVGQINTAGTSSASSATTGFFLTASAATMVTYATLVISLVDPANNYWVATGTAARDDGTDVAQFTSGGVALPGIATQVQITALNGTDTFDAGTINILYE